MINKFKRIILKFCNNKNVFSGIVVIVIGNIIYNNLNKIISLVDLIKIFLFFNILIPTWSIILIIIVLFYTRYSYLHHINKNFLKYIEDKIDSIIWSWEYEQNPENKYSIINLNPHCPLCNCELSLDHHQYYKCPDPVCKNNKSMDVYKKNNDDIVKIIKNRVLEKHPKINIHEIEIKK